MTQLQIGNAEQIEQRRKDEAWLSFEGAAIELLSTANMPWYVIGRAIASAADLVTADSETYQDWMDFQRGYDEYIKEVIPQPTESK